MKKVIILLFMIFMAETAVAETKKNTFTLTEAISFALKNNPGILAAEKEIDLTALGVDAAKTAKMPKIDLIGNATRYRYPTALTPISGSPLAGTEFPEFDNLVYDFGISFRLPLYRGGRLARGVHIAEVQKLIAEDIYAFNRQELAYNITSVVYKIAQLEKLLEAAEASKKQLEKHKRNVELFLEAGTVPRVELLKTEVEFARTQEHVLRVSNSLESAFELLKTLMGLDDKSKITVVQEAPLNDPYPSLEESLDMALARRPDYQAVLKKQMLTEEKVKMTAGKRLPDIYLAAEYLDRAGEQFAFKENWSVALKLALPVFDGGLINTEVKQGKKEAEKVRQEERSLKFAISREIKDAYMTIENARQRTEVTQKGVETAKETLRIEMLKYETGTGTSTDVIDAEAALLNAETAYHQAVFDNKLAVAAMKKAVGEDICKEVAVK
ncbi:MAG: TolC family protein [Nitrospiraceae bacterium]|nr:TolC family protein [Nitrospiraceae bacterium]